MLLGSESGMGSCMPTFRHRCPQLGALAVFQGAGLRDPRVWLLKSQHQTFSRNRTSFKPHGDRRRMEDGDAASCCPRQPSSPHPASLCPHPLPRGESGPDSAAPPSPTHPAPSPPLGLGSLELHKATCRSLRCAGRGGERAWVPLGRGQDTGARRDPQHRPHAAAAAAARGYFAALRTRSGRDRAPPPPVPLALPELRSTRCTPAPLPGDRHCQAERRPLRARRAPDPRDAPPTGLVAEVAGSAPARRAPPAPVARAAAGSLQGRRGRVGSRAGRGFLRVRRARSLRSWALQFLPPRPAQK